MASEKQSLIHSEEDKKDFFNDVFRPCLAEFVGVALFVCVGCMSVQDPLGISAGGAKISTSAVAVALTHGLTIALLVVAFGGVSGAHLNPAVTLGITLSGGIKPFLALCYIISQLLGALVGAGFVRAILPLTTFIQISGGAHMLNEQVGIANGILCETILTTVLVLTVILSAVDEQNKSALAPLAIGFAVTVDILAGISVTGASMNPARSLGPAVAISVYNGAVWTHHYIYWVGPFLGAGLAALLYRLIFANPEKRLICKG